MHVNPITREWGGAKCLCVCVYGFLRVSSALMYQMLRQFPKKSNKKNHCLPNNGEIWFLCHVPIVGQTHWCVPASAFKMLAIEIRQTKHSYTYQQKKTKTQQQQVLNTNYLTFWNPTKSLRYQSNLITHSTLYSTMIYNNILLYAHWLWTLSHSAQPKCVDKREDTRQQQQQQQTTHTHTHTELITPIATFWYIWKCFCIYK